MNVLTNLANSIFVDNNRDALIGVTFAIFVIVSILGMINGTRMKKRIKLRHPDVWREAGYPPDLVYPDFVPADKEAQCAQADRKLGQVLSKSRRRELNDPQLERLIKNQSIIGAVSLTLMACLIYMTFAV